MKVDHLIYNGVAVYVRKLLPSGIQCQQRWFQIYVCEGCEREPYRFVSHASECNEFKRRACSARLCQRSTLMILSIMNFCMRASKLDRAPVPFFPSLVFHGREFEAAPACRGFSPHRGCSFTLVPMLPNRSRFHGRVALPPIALTVLAGCCVP